MPLIIAIDGPAAAGKSSVAKALAKKLNLLYLDSGSLYRAMAWKVLQKGIDPTQQSAVEWFCEGLNIISRVGGEVFVDHENITSFLRLPEVTRLSSQISIYPGVRKKLVSLQRALAQSGAVIEGRDIGTVVFPSADFKFYLDASLEVRGERRFKEMAAKGIVCDLKTVITDIQKRDNSDRERTVAPLRAAPDGIIIDSTSLSLDGVLEQMQEKIRKKP
jgi:cytidylate kinase